MTLPRTIALLSLLLLIPACSPTAAAPTASPVDKLGNTQWKFNNVVITFKPDGTYFFSDWGEKRGTWKSISPQSIETMTYAALKCEFTINPTLSYIAWRDGNGEFGLATRIP